MVYTDISVEIQEMLKRKFKHHIKIEFNMFGSFVSRLESACTLDWSLKLSHGLSAGLKSHLQPSGVTSLVNDSPWHGLVLLWRFLQLPKEACPSSAGTWTGKLHA